MNNFLQNFAKSSANPEALSLTIKGAIIGILPMYLLVGQILNIPLAETDLANFAQIAGALVFSALTLVGLIRKLYHFGIKFYSKISTK